MGDMVSNVCDIVMKRVFMPRVGVLWTSEGPKMYQWQSCDEVTWVHYVPENFSEAFKVDNNPCYFVESLEDPRCESATLSALAIPMASMQLISEIYLGIPYSAAGLLVDGCLEKGMPVVLHIGSAKCHPEATAAKKGTFEDILLKLSKKGIAVIAGDEFVTKEGTVSKTLYVEEEGWISWCEIADRLSGVCRVLLGKKARLTDEALDRLRSLGIKVEER